MTLAAGMGASGQWESFSSWCLVLGWTHLPSLSGSFLGVP